MDLLIVNLEHQFKRSSTISEEYLGDLIQHSLDFNVRQSITCQQLDVIISITQYYIRTVCSSQNTPPDSDVKILILTLKLLRNMCAGVLNNQQYIGQTPFIQDIKRLFELESKNVVLVTCSLQLLGNICVANSYGQELIWNECYPSVFCSLTSWGNENICNTCSMVVYNCIRACPKKIQQLTDGSGTNIVMLLLMSLKTSEDCTEWIVLLLEFLLENTSLQTLSILLSDYPHARIALLDLLLAYSDDTGATMKSNGDRQSLFQSVFTSHCNLLYLMREYKVTTAKLLKYENILACIYHTSLSSSSFPMETKELTKTFISILNLLAACSSYMILLKDMQQEMSVLQCSLNLLNALSKLDGSLNSAQNRSHSSSENSSVSDHPLFCVKRDIVRLIGNVCYHSSVSQELVHDFIPLLLNQCNIDHYNPYIMQWGIWTIHNICHNNIDNQKIVRQLEQKGGVNLKQLEDQLDCQVEVDEDGKLRIKKKDN